MTRPTHHFYVHRHKIKKPTAKPIQPLDNIVLLLSFIEPLSGLPQVFSVWNGGGVSALTWFFFLIFGFLMLAYGIVHRVWPIIASNVIWTVLDVFIILGALKN